MYYDRFLNKLTLDSNSSEKSRSSSNRKETNKSKYFTKKFDIVLFEVNLYLEENYDLFNKENYKRITFSWIIPKYPLCIKYSHSLNIND